MIRVTRLNHAVLFVREFDRALQFYQYAFGFEVISQTPGKAAFLRARESSNHHDLGLFATPVGTRSPLGSPGLYHLAWEVPTIEDLAAARDALMEFGALIGESDHGATKSLYGKDPDGNEFEIMWLVPRQDWGEHEHAAQTARLDLERELALYGSDTP